MVTTSYKLLQLYAHYSIPNPLPSSVHGTLAHIPIAKASIYLSKVFLWLWEPPLWWMAELLRSAQHGNHIDNKLCMGCSPFLSHAPIPLLVFPGIPYKRKYCYILILELVVAREMESSVWVTSTTWTWVKSHLKPMGHS